MVSRGKRPQKPRDFDAPGTSKAVWKVAEKCWHNDASKRPEVREVLGTSIRLLTLVSARTEHAPI